MLSVQLLEYSHINKDNSCVIGEVDFYVVEKKYTARRVRHLKKGNSKWFNWPSFARDRENGSPEWLALGEFPSEENEQIFASLKVEVDKYLEDERIKEGEGLPF